MDATLPASLIQVGVRDLQIECALPVTALVLIPRACKIDM